MTLDLELMPAGTPGGAWVRTVFRSLWLALAAVGLLASGCSKETAMASIETDAHGYLCHQCGAKFYTGAREFLEGKCPKCSQEALDDVVGYWCDKDQHMTIRPRIISSATPAICEKCGAALRGKLVSPKEKDLTAWGATKTSPH